MIMRLLQLKRCHSLKSVIIPKLKLLFELTRAGVIIDPNLRQYLALADTCKFHYCLPLLWR